MFNFCNDSSQKWVIVLSAHMVKEFPLSLVLHSCAILKPGLAAIISARDGETRDVFSIRVWLILGMNNKHPQINRELIKSISADV